VPSQVTISGIQRVLQLVARRAHLDPRSLDHSRRHRRRAGVLAQPGDDGRTCSFTAGAADLRAKYFAERDYLPFDRAWSAKWEQAFAESLIGQGEDRSLAMQPSRLSEFMTVVRDRFEQAAREGEAAGAGDLGGDQAVRTFAGGTFPGPNHRFVAGGDPSAGAAEDGRKRLIACAATQDISATGKGFIGWATIGTILCHKARFNSKLL